MRKTESICPICLKKVEAKICKKNGYLVIEKRCEEHGKFSIPHWQSSKIFDFVEKYDYFKSYEKIRGENFSNVNCPFACGLCNDHLSKTVIGVIDLTKRCDLSCVMCFASFSDKETSYEPSKDEIFKMLDFMSRLNPKPPAVLFSGGEPLLREDLPEIIAFAHKMGFLTILATNGIRIAKFPEIIANLKKSGLNVVYLQFDSLNDEFYEKFRGGKLLKYKLKVIELCRKYDVEIILVPTLIAGANNHEIGDLIRFAAENSDIVRGLVFQPIAYTGRATDMPEAGATVDTMFAEEVEAQTLGEIRATDLYPIPIMVPPIIVMRKFMKKPWPLFSCSPHCGIVNWIYVSKNGRLIPINRLLNFEKFFEELNALSKSINSKGKIQILFHLFLAALKSLNLGLVHREIGIINFLKTVLRVHVSPTYRSLGELRRRILLLGCMAFMDRYNFDVARVRRCVIHFITPDLKVIPFCAYNNIYRTEIEERYAKKARN